MINSSFFSKIVVILPFIVRFEQTSINASRLSDMSGHQIDRGGADESEEEEEEAADEEEGAMNWRAAIAERLMGIPLRLFLISSIAEHPTLAERRK